MEHGWLLVVAAFAGCRSSSQSVDSEHITLAHEASDMEATGYD